MKAKRRYAAVVASFAMGFGTAVAAAGDTDLDRLSREAGSRGGVAASCGIDVSGFAGRIEALLKDRAANGDEAARLIGIFQQVMAETRRAQASGRSVNCENVKGEFAALAINKPGWTVKKDPN